MKLGIVGLGRLGLPMATYYASKGHEVTGLDINASTIRRLQNGECPVEETNLEELLKQQKITFTTIFADLMESEIVFIIVPTPSGEDGGFINDYVVDALKHLKDYKGLVVITSTVMPGSCEEKFMPLLPSAGLCYNPEFIALSSVLYNMANPDSILIGEDSKESGDLLELFHRSLYDVPICRMSLWNAELAKISLNVFVTTKISLVNTIAEACEGMPSGDIGKVAGFLGLDGRIGSKFMVSGLGFGGPCFPRDNRAFIAFANELGINHQLQSATDEFNEKHWRSIVRRILALCKGDTVSILGLTYKPDTNVVEESRAIKIANTLSSLPSGRFIVKVYDPQGMENARKELKGVEFCDSVKKCVKDSDLCVIATPWEEFANLDLRGMKVLDCWRILKNTQGVDYHALGVNKFQCWG